MRRSFWYEVYLHGAEFSGRCHADCGTIDTLELPDGTPVAIRYDFSAIDEGQGRDALTLASLIARKVAQEHDWDLEQSQPERDDRGLAPVVI